MRILVFVLALAAVACMNNNSVVLNHIVEDPICGTPLDDGELVSTDAVLWYRHGLARKSEELDAWAKEMLQAVRELSSSPHVSNSQIIDWVDIIDTLAKKTVVHRTDWHHIRGEMYEIFARCYSIPEFDGRRGATGSRAHVYHYRDMERKMQAVAEFIQRTLNDHYLSESTMSKMNRCSAIRAVIASCRAHHTCESDIGYWKNIERDCRLSKW